MGFHYLIVMAMILENEAKLTSQNQVTIPANVRKFLKLRGGKSRVKFQMLASGSVMMVTVEDRPKKTEDAVLKPFLDLLAHDMTKAPERIQPFPKDLIKRARSLTAGVKVDMNGPLTGKD